MPAVTENTMVDSKGEVVTDFIDSVGTSSVSYTYTNTQTSLYIRNDSDVSITVTVNGSPTTVTRLSDTTITAEFTSFSIVSASGIASFYARSLRGVPTNTTSTSQLNVISGTAASPSITAIADANTGIFFPASETIAFSTNGSERVRVNSSGQVGIGCDPTSTLEVKSAQGVIKLASTTGTNSTYHKIDNTGGTLTLGIDNSTGSSQFGAGNYAAGLWHSGNYNLTFGTNNSVRMTISGGGNVGIGTTSPTNKLQIDGVTANTSCINAVANTTTGQSFGIALSAGTNSSDYALNIRNAAQTSQLFHITGAGNVGIGTASPSVKLQVVDASDAKIQSVRTGGCTVQIEGGGSAGFLKTTTNHNLVIGTNNADSMTLTTAGYLLIGYTSSNGAYPLQVNGQIFATSSTIATSDGKYKKDVVALDGALDIVKALNPVQFSWKDHPVHKFNTDVPTVGFIAQEVEQALADKSYLTSIIKKSECTWETETGEFVEREVTRDVEKQVEREITEEIDGEEVTRTVTETVIEQVTEIVTEPVKETHTEEFLGIAESNLIAILTKAVKELAAEVEALKAQLNGN